MTPHPLNPEDLQVDSFETAQSTSRSFPTLTTDPTAETFCYICPVETYNGACV